MILYYLGMNPMFPAGTIASPVDWLVPIPTYYLPAYIFALTFFPVGFAAAAKISDFDPRKLPQEGEAQQAKQKNALSSRSRIPPVPFDSLSRAICAGQYFKFYVVCLVHSV